MTLGMGEDIDEPVSSGARNGAPDQRPIAASHTVDPAAAWLPSPNAGPRKSVAAPDMVVIHYTAMRSCDEALDRLRDPAAEVSAHYVIKSDGALFGLVAEERRAWHAGASAWGGATDINSRAIGVELDHPGAEAGDGPPFTAAQMDTLCRLLKGALARWRIDPRRVLGHSDVAPGRKRDPGPRFDWLRLARLGLAAQPAARTAGQDATAEADAAAAMRSVRSRLISAGFGPWDDAALLDALRRRAPALAGPPGAPASGNDVFAATELASVLRCA